MRCIAWQGTAWRGLARPGRAWPGMAGNPSQAGDDFGGIGRGLAWRGLARQGEARHGREPIASRRRLRWDLGVARQGESRPGQARRGMAGNPSQAGDDFGGIGIVCNK